MSHTIITLCQLQAVRMSETNCQIPNVLNFDRSPFPGFFLTGKSSIFLGFLACFSFDFCVVLFSQQHQLAAELFKQSVSKIRPLTEQF